MPGQETAISLEQENQKLREKNAELRKKLQEQRENIRNLEQSRMLLGVMAESYPDAFLVYEIKNNNCLYASPSCQDLLGYEPASMEGRELSGLIHQDDLWLLQSALDQARSGQRQELHCHWLHARGAYHYLELVVSAVGISSPELAVIVAREPGRSPGSEDLVEEQNSRLRALRDELRLANARLQRNRENLEMAIWSADQGMWDWDIPAGLISVNEHLNEMLGWADSPLEMSYDAWQQSIHPDDRRRVAAELEAYRDSRGGAFELQYRIRNRQQRYLWVEDRGRMVAWDERGRGIRALGLRRVVQQAKAIEEQLREKQESVASLLDTIPEIVVLADAAGHITWSNDQGREFFGDDLLGRRLNDYTLISFPNEDIIGTMAALRPDETGPVTIENTCRRRDGQHCILRWQCKTTGSKQGPPGILASARDVTEMRRSQEKVRFMSFHDRLTGVYNRAFVEEEMKRLDVDRQLPISVIVGDVNALKLTNDTFGHFEGDRLLTSLAEILRKSCRDEDIIARWGGDEFVIFLPRTSNEEAENICGRIKEACRLHPLSPVRPSIALGAATKIAMKQSLYALIREAENRMYRNKQLEGHESRQLIIESLEKRLFQHSKESPESIARLRSISEVFGRYLGLSAVDTERLMLLARLHDIGYISIDESIINKRGPLTKEEWDVIKKHPEIGMRIAQSSNDLAFLSEDIFHHHERWDGQGYPQGLKGKNIPLKSRIFAIIDAYDSMTSQRAYREPFTHEQALDELKECAGKHFDPELVKHFINIFD